MTVYWRCSTCPANGTGDRAAEQHTRSTTHTTETSARPRTPEQAQSVRYWLTPAGEQALAASGWSP